ncbi:DEAD/DEAH box helicase [Paeniroseomonas aquatica]|uniref:DEAD/DEAH box helicase n=3 Tax=Paeniroseomonas aquatica TaxID=373043 RepID=A0ABT8AEP1_9PROT|nr:DEAD/DEAH box helicase [Paeniroseomonas aquatica]MDN3568297.1 DEAD/DEAH box helicase [Paeniroseomonas aquatica]
MQKRDTIPPASLRPVEDAEILRAMSSNALVAGHRYVSQGRVRRLSWAEDGRRIEAETQGTQRRPYGQTITLRPDTQGQVGFTGLCTCPVGLNCKHVAAVLVASRRRQAAATGAATAPDASGPAKPPDPSPPAAAPAALSYDVMAWLDSLNDTKDAALEAYPDTIRQRLLYVLEVVPGPAAGGLLQVSCCTVTLRRDGGFGAPRAYAPRQVEMPAHYLRASDKLILRRLARFGYGAPTLDRDEDPADLLRRIVATGRAHWAEVIGPVVAEAPERKGSIGWVADADGNQRAAVQLDPGLLGFMLPSPWYADTASGAIGPVDPGVPQGVAVRLLAAPPIPAAAAPKVAAELARRLPEHAVAAPAALGPPETLRGPPRVHLRLTQASLPFDPAQRSTRRYPFSGSSYEVPLAQLAFGYGPLVLPFGREEPPAVITHEGKLYRLQRDEKAEAAVLRRMTGIGFARVNQVAPVPIAFRHGTDFVLDDDSDGTDWLHVLTREVPALRNSGWQVEVAAEFPIRLVEPDGPLEVMLEPGGGQAKAPEPETIEEDQPSEFEVADVEAGPGFTEGSGIDWLELHLGVVVGGQRIDLIPILVMLIANGSGAALARTEDGDEDAPFLVPLPDGRLLSLPRARVRPIMLALIEIFSGGGIGPAPGPGGKVRFTPHDAAELAALEAESGLPWLGGDSLRLLGRQLREAGDAIPEVTLPEGFHGALRPYQAQGVGWLQVLRAAGLGGVLADDMGLGKTVQTLAHVAIEKAAGRLDRPVLIVCPTSLVPNWTREAARFAPDLKLLALHGPNRAEQFGGIARHDLVLTTYPLLTRDHAVLTLQSWHVVILDEAQTIKNPNAETTRHALRLQARQRLCLSGTPLQNHLGELWSLFDFVAPGFLGSAKDFRSRFRNPIEKAGNAEKQAMLHRRVKPFLLRRTKDEVVTELPPKTEITEPVELGTAQRGVYEGIRLAMHARVKDAIAEKGMSRSGIIILDALLKLRQACCDPRLLKLKAARDARAGSAKLDRLMEMLETMLEEGRKVLLFSQFTSMLELIERRLADAGIEHELLTGETKDRDIPVRRFQAGEVPVFLISLKAGGVGLNLTAADTVIHYDPWWNPAVEDQATDRAHRIGQEKHVFVHRLVTLGTIEEKMEVLKERKRALVASVLDAEHGGALKLTEADVEELFAPAE